MTTARGEADAARAELATRLRAEHEAALLAAEASFDERVTAAREAADESWASERERLTAAHAAALTCARGRDCSGEQRATEAGRFAAERA
ncbi:MAG: hypothetical protein HS111_06590 [Kofleriaceae bacterium]|nr:hypothetical protein [Kofleriaceae bacterium]